MTLLKAFGATALAYILLAVFIALFVGVIVLYISVAANICCGFHFYR